MNILIPDIWLRDYLKTKATPEKIKECLSLCGPSVERIYGKGKETVYDVEITGNRPDAMSVIGIAREAATILPRFGIAATLTGDPYTIVPKFPKPKRILPLRLTTDPVLNPRWMSVLFDNVRVGKSPSWLTNYLTLTGIRSIHNVVDITNYLMRAYGQPAHVFDYDSIAQHTMTLRASKRGEVLTTLDGKKQKLPGGDIVIEDGTGKLIDLCGIMGGENSSVTEKTTRVVLFLQTYSPTHIRKTSMTLSHRTEASALFEKGLDSELVKPAMSVGVELMQKLTGAAVVSKPADIYPSPYKPHTVRVAKNKIHSYTGTLPAKDVRRIMRSLGCTFTENAKEFLVTAPSYRRDISLDVDVIEEIARIWGYHEIPSVLPNHAPPVTQPDPVLHWENEIKIRLRDWGFTELLSYSMISEELMEIFSFEKDKTYTIMNPLTKDWVYMRPHAIASTLPAFIQNITLEHNLKAFELSMSYVYRPDDLPLEVPVLNVLWAGDTFFETRGLAEALFLLMGIDFRPETTRASSRYTQKNLIIGSYASLGVLAPDLLSKLGTTTPITRLYLNIENMVRDARPAKQYVPIPKYPPIVEDLSFVVPDTFQIGPLITKLKTAHRLVSDITLLDIHKHSRTLHIMYQDPSKNLTTEEVAPIRKALIEIAEKKFGVALKSR